MAGFIDDLPTTKLGVIAPMDLALLPDESFFAQRPLLASATEFLRARLLPLPATLERLDGCVWFAEKLLHSGEERAATHLRAALADLVSMEEMQALDRPGQRALKVRDSRYPTTHLLGLMRHLNVHVKGAKLKTLGVSAKIDAHEFNMEVAIVTDLSAADLAGLHNGKHYASPDLQRTVDWFNEAQLHWGAGYLVRISAELYAEEVAKHHGC